MARHHSTTLTSPRKRDLVRDLLDLMCERGLTVGDQLPPIRELAVSLGVKPTVVRDALLQARAMGLVRILPRAGAFVQSLAVTSPADGLANSLPTALAREDRNLFHLLDARRLIEIELAGRAAERRRLEDLLPVRRALEAMARIPLAERRADYVEHDIRFHVEIARLAGNSVLLTVQQALLEMLRPHLVELTWDRERQERTDRSHAALYTALVAADAPRARTEMSDHLSMAYNSLLEDVQTSPVGLASSTEEGPRTRRRGKEAIR